MRRICLSLAFALVTVPLSAQPRSTWSVMTGIEQFEFRDIVRAGPPVDASPVVWHGRGPAVTLERDRSTRTRSHILNITILDARAFTYVTPARSLMADGNDAARRIESRYEYDRRVLSRVVPSALDLAVGIRGSGSYLGVTHDIDPSLDIGFSTRQAGAAFVAAAAFARGRRVWVDVRYGNGIAIAWIQPNGGHSGASGGGWTTELETAVNVRITPATGITGRYVARGDTLLGGHRSFATNTPGFLVGVRYAK